MAYTTIDDGSVYFQTALYSSSGGGGSITVTNDGNSDLQPDLIWIKVRNDSNDHNMFDSSRSNFGERIFPNQASASDSVASVSASSDGFATGTGYGDINNTSGANNYVAWQWKCNGGTSSASGSESGSNLAYNFQVNTTSKFMINLYTGRGSSSTLNLGNHFTPAWMLFRNRDQNDDWVVYHHKNTSNPHTDHLHLNNTNATSDDEQMFEDVIFAADEINLGTNHEVNADNEDYVAYAWAEVQGFSKFGSFIGNGSSDGAFVYTGFKPAFILWKGSDLAENWIMYDTKRDPTNLAFHRLDAERNNAESTNTGSTNPILDILSNGFKMRGSGDVNNGDGHPYIYAAFAEHPFVSSKGVPVTAR